MKLENRIQSKLTMMHCGQKRQRVVDQGKQETYADDHKYFPNWYSCGIAVAVPVGIRATVRLVHTHEEASTVTGDDDGDELKETEWVGGDLSRKVNSLFGVHVKRWKEFQPECSPWCFCWLLRTPNE
jgi:hypothetical protein